MLSATLRAARDGSWRAATIRGHAGAGVKGDDPVCAAVSLLADATLYSLSAGHGIEPRLARGEGELALALPDGLDERQRAAAQVLLDNLRNGLGLLAERFPRQVTLLIEND